MLLVKTQLGKSKINGIGLFAGQNIPKGMKVWKFSPAVDFLISKSQMKKLPERVQKQFHKYAYFDSHYKKYVFCGDDARFFNHSDSSNCLDFPNMDKGDITIAARNIKKGEELTCNYKIFYGNLNEHPEIK